jgi:hypothetical protein
MTITRVGPLSVAKVVGLLYTVLGLIFGGIISLMAIAGGFAADEGGGALFGAVMGAGAVILLPICYGGLGFIMSLIGTWLFNIAAGMVGGIEVDAR